MPRRIIVDLTEREAQEILGHTASSGSQTKSKSERIFYKRLENKVRRAWRKKLERM